MAAEVARAEHQREHGGETQERQRPHNHYDYVVHRHATSPLGDIVARTLHGYDLAALLAASYSSNLSRRDRTGCQGELRTATIRSWRNMR